MLRLEFVRDVYDVVQTIGLILAGKAAKDEYVSFRLRVEVVRSHGEREFRAMLWHVKEDNNSLTFLGHPRIAQISETTPEAVIEAVLKVLNSIGARAPAILTEQPLPRWE